MVYICQCRQITPEQLVEAFRSVKAANGDAPVAAGDTDAQLGAMKCGAVRACLTKRQINSMKQGITIPFDASESRITFVMLRRGVTIHRKVFPIYAVRQ